MKLRVEVGAFALFCVAIGVVLIPANSFAQEAATQDPPAATEPAVEEPAVEVDPYVVPEGGVDEMLKYIRTGQRNMKPKSREDVIRMFQSLNTAATRIYEATDATPVQRIQAANNRAMFLSRMEMFGEPTATEQLKTFMSEVASDPNPELQKFAKMFLLNRAIGKWASLPPEAKQQVLADIRAGLADKESVESTLPMVMNFADAVSETDEVPLAVELITEALPLVAASDNPKVAERAPRMEGIIRRLQLPGNEMELEGTLVNGEMVDWSAYRGKVVLVDYWATWCGPCIAELPNVIAAYEAYHDKGFDVLGISLDSKKEAVEKFMVDKKIPWQSLYSDDEENNGWSHPMAVRYAINGIPRAILVDQEGKVLYMSLRGKDLHEALAKLLGPVEPAADADANSGEQNAEGKTAATP